MEKGLTLAEVLITLFIFALAIGMLTPLYISINKNVDIELYNAKAWEIARSQLELLRTNMTIYNITTIPQFITHTPSSTSSATTSSSSTSTLHFILVPRTFSILSVNDTSQSSGIRLLSSNEVGNFTGFYYLYPLYLNTTGIAPNIVLAEVIVCYRAGNIVIGEDKNLDGRFEVREDTDRNFRISSPIRLWTIFAREN